MNKDQKGSRTSFSTTFSHFVYNFSRKMFLMLYTNKWPNKILWLPWLFEILGNCVLQLFVNQAVTSEILELTLSFYSTWLKSQEKNEISWEGKELLRWNKKRSLSFLKDFLLLKTLSDMIKAAVQRCSVKEVFLEISQNSQENTCASVSFLIKLLAWGLQLYLKSDSGTGVFLWILRNF